MEDEEKLPSYEMKAIPKPFIAYGVWTGEYDDTHMVALFSTREKAEKYVEVSEKIDEYGLPYWITAYTLDKCEISKDTQVRDYYVFGICISNDEFFGEYFDEICDLDQPTSKIYQGDTFKEANDDWLFAYSVNSYEEAKELALDEYNKRKVMKNNDSIN